MDKKEELVKEKTLQQEVVEQMSKLATSGFGLVAALAWNEAIQSLIRETVDSNEYLKKLGAGLFYKFFYAILITFLIVVITYYLSKLANRLETELNKSKGKK